MDTPQIIGIALGLGVVAILLLIIFIKTNIVLCQPNELVVISGRQRKLADGTMIGYRVLRGGRGFKRPLVESVGRMPLNSIPIEIQIDDVMTDGMIPVAIEARATVKLAGREADGMDAAIERFLGKGVDAVAKTAAQALEGAIRGVVATMSPEEANSKRLELAQQGSSIAREDLKRLGIVLDFLQIQEVNDKQGYLAAIGRRRNAAVQRDAKVAEAMAEAEARQVAAEQQRVGREAEITSEQAIIKRENALAVERADLLGEENRATERAGVAGHIARVTEEIELHAKRVELAEKKKEADIVVPAAATRKAMMLEAEGHAARILEDGKAKANALELLRQQWQDGESENLFLIHLMPELVDKVTRVVSENLRIDKLTILDGGNGEGLPAYVKNLTNSAITMFEQMTNATGVDIARLAKGKGNGNGTELPKELD
ncbi:MAG: flotillin family protein [Planctomycetota bacterium]|jgi:flotillin